MAKMAEKKNSSSFVKQAAILAVASLLVRVIGFLYRVPLTNMIGDEGNGIYSAGYYLYNFFLVMSSAGLPVAISKMVSERITLGQFKNAKRVFKYSLIVSSIMGLFFGLLMFFGARVFCELFNSPRSYHAILTLAPTVFIVAILAVFRGYFQGMNTTVPTAMSQIVEQIFNAIFSVYLAYILVGYGVEYGAAGGTAGTGIGAIAALATIFFIFLRSRPARNELFSADKNDYELEGPKKIIITLFKTSVPIIIGTAIFSLTNLVDMSMVNSRLAASGRFSAEEIDALYGQLTGKYVTLSNLPVSISTALATAVIPSIAGSMVKNDLKVVQSKIDTTLRLAMIISIPAAVGIGVLSDQLLSLLFPSHADGGTLLKVGSFSIIFLALSQISTGVLQGIGKVQVPAKNALLGALAKIPVNYFLIVIPSINVIGAVISTTVCYIVASLLNFRALVKATKVKPDYVGTLLKPFLASVIMGLICLATYKLIYLIYPSNALATLVSVFIAIIAYAVALALMKGFVRQDLSLVPMGNKLIRLLEKFNLIA